MRGPVADECLPGTWRLPMRWGESGRTIGTVVNRRVDGNSGSTPLRSAYSIFPSTWCVHVIWYSAPQRIHQSRSSRGQVHIRDTVTDADTGDEPRLPLRCLAWTRELNRRLVIVL